MEEIQNRFNRAARFARLVALVHGTLGMGVGIGVSIGPRVSRGWWRGGRLRRYVRT